MIVTLNPTSDMETGPLYEITIIGEFADGLTLRDHDCRRGFCRRFTTEKKRWAGLP